MYFKELKKELEVIEDKYKFLRTEENHVRTKIRDCFLTIFSPLVGLYFKENDRYYYVYRVPYTKMDKRGYSHFNEYQLPVFSFRLYSDTMPDLTDDTKFTKIVDIVNENNINIENPELIVESFIKEKEGREKITREDFISDFIRAWEAHEEKIRPENERIY